MTNPGQQILITLLATPYKTLPLHLPAVAANSFFEQLSMGQNDVSRRSDKE